MILEPVLDILIGGDLYDRQIERLHLTLDVENYANRAEFRIVSMRDIMAHKGDEVCIYLGYVGSAKCVFAGRIREVYKMDTYYDIICEDWYCKLVEYYLQDKLTGKASEIIQHICESAGINVRLSNLAQNTDFTLNQVGSLGVSGAEIIDTIKRLTGWYIYMIPGTDTLYVGPPAPYARGDLQGPVYVLSERLNCTKIDITKRLPARVGQVVVYVVDQNGVMPYVKAVEGEGKPRVVRYFQAAYSSIEEARRLAQERAKQLYKELNSAIYSGVIHAIGHPGLMPGMTVRIEPLNGVPYYADIKTVMHNYSVQEGFTTDIYIEASWNTE